ncbi:hypothetical protein Droror1_Dr00009224 [Drosera rotundifolia]
MKFSKRGRGRSRGARRGRRLRPRRNLARGLKPGSTLLSRNGKSLRVLLFADGRVLTKVCSLDFVDQVNQAFTFPAAAAPAGSRRRRYFLSPASATTIASSPSEIAVSPRHHRLPPPSSSPFDLGASLRRGATYQGEERRGAKPPGTLVVGRRGAHSSPWAGQQALGLIGPGCGSISSKPGSAGKQSVGELIKGGLPGSSAQGSRVSGAHQSRLAREFIKGSLPRNSSGAIQRENPKRPLYPSL